MLQLGCVGINRREVVNERVIQERNSETILTPSHAGANRKVAPEALE
jgi:peptide subunit release factor RF-3